MGIILIVLALFGFNISYHDLIYYIGLFTLLSKAWPLLPVLRRKIFGDKSKQLNEKNPEKDVVYFFQFPGTATAPSTCAFSVKVEAFCRLNKIKYKKQNSFTSRGSNSQMPFVELNGETISDSQIIIRRLTEKLKIQAYPNAEAAAIGHAIDRMLDNHTFNLNVHAKLDKLSGMIQGMSKSSSVPAFIFPVVAALGAKIMRSKLEQRVQTSIGVFTDVEYKELLRNDLLQLQTILGNNKFLLGEEPTAVDCTALGQLGVAYYAVPAARTTVHELMDSEELSGLKEYLARTKEAIYGDRFFDPEARA